MHPGGPFRPNDVVKYTPDPTRHDPNWCREGVAIASDPNMILTDTYWGSGTDAHILTPTETATAEVLFNLDDYDQLPRNAWDTWTQYAEADRGIVTSQHGLQRRLFIRKGAKPDWATMLENARDKVEAAEREVRHATSLLTYARRELADLEAQV